MFNKERIENLEKRVKELERKEGISKLSEDVSKRLIHALIDSNNEVVKRVFDDVCVRSVYGTSVFQPPKAGDIHASNAVFNGIPDSLKKVEEDKMEAHTITETDKIKAGETFIYVDCLDVQHKVIAKNVRTLGDCKSCVFNNDACCLVKCSKSDRESKDDVYFEEIY